MWSLLTQGVSCGKVLSPYQMRSEMLSGWLKVMELILHAASVWTLLPASEFIAPSGGSVFPA